MKSVKLTFALIICLSLLTSGCSPRQLDEGPAPDTVVTDPAAPASPAADEPSLDADAIPEQSVESLPEDAEAPTTLSLQDSGYQITIPSPFIGTEDTASNNLTVTVDSDPSFQGYIFHDTSAQGFSQLEESVKTMEDAIKQDPTIIDFKKDVKDQGNGLFSFTFTYTAGEAEGSPAGYFYIHYQKTATGVLTANFTCPKLNYSDQVMELFASIVPVE